MALLLVKIVGAIEEADGKEAAGISSATGSLSSSPFRFRSSSGLKNWFYFDGWKTDAKVKADKAAEETEEKTSETSSQTSSVSA